MQNKKQKEGSQEGGAFHDPGNPAKGLTKRNT